MLRTKERVIHRSHLFPTCAQQRDRIRLIAFLNGLSLLLDRIATSSDFDTLYFIRLLDG